MAKTRTELIHCDNCGEDYAATYRRCPFCNAKRSGGREESEGYDYLDDDYDASPHRGGKRLATEGRSVGEWIKLGLYIFASLVILAAIWIMCTMVIPKLFPARPSAEPSPSEDAAVTLPSPSTVPTAEPSPSDDLPVVDDDPLSLDSPDLPTVEPDPFSTQIPATTAPNAELKLSSTDFTLSPKYPTYQMEITGVGRAQATYSMSNESVATVSSTGLITAVGNGNTTLTVTDQNGNTGTAIVRVSGMSAAQTTASATPAPSATATSSGSAKLNYSDFSITAQYPDPIRLRVQGGEAAGWKSSNTGVATVSDNGTVTGVGNGSAKITCTLSDGSTLTCDVYVSGK